MVIILTESKSFLNDVIKIKNIKITIPKLKQRELIYCAKDHYNHFMIRKGNCNFYIKEPVPEPILNRLCVNFLRHELSNYHNLLNQYSFKRNATTIKKLIKLKIYHAIIENYRYLKEECFIQIKKRKLTQYEKYLK